MTRAPVLARCGQARAWRSDLKVLALVTPLLLGCEGPDDVAAAPEPPPLLVGDTAEHPARPGPARAPETFVGMLHPPMPEDVDVVAWSLVTGPHETDATSEYSLSHVRAGAHRLLWLSRVERRITEPTEHGSRITSISRVVDVVEVTGVEPHTRLLLYPCRTYDGTRAAAIVERRPPDEAPPVLRAWRVDVRAGRLLAASPSAIRCDRAE